MLLSSILRIIAIVAIVRYRIRSGLENAHLDAGYDRGSITFRPKLILNDGAP